MRIARILQHLGLACLGLACLGLAFHASPALSQAYPARTLHFVSAFPPGSGADIIVRYFADRIGTLTRQSIVVENRTGANGNIALEHTLRSPPDGYTIFIHAANAIASNSHLIKNNRIEMSQVQIAATINQQGFMVAVDRNSPIQSIQDLTARLKSGGEKVSYGSSSNQGLIAGSLLNEMGGFNAVFVNYRTSADSLNDIASGALDFAFIDPAAALAMERQGRIRILAVMLDQRLPFRPDIPTLAENGYPISIVGWFAAVVPAATPAEIVDQINGWMRTIIATPEAEKFLADTGAVPWTNTPAEGQARLLKDVETWRSYIRAAKLTPQ